MARAGVRRQFSWLAAVWLRGCKITHLQMLGLYPEPEPEPKLGPKHPDARTLLRMIEVVHCEDTP